MTGFSGATVALPSEGVEVGTHLNGLRLRMAIIRSLIMWCLRGTLRKGSKIGR